MADDAVRPVKPRAGRPNFVFTPGDWMINIDEIACCRLHGKDKKLERVEVWFKGQQWPQPALTLEGEAADTLMNVLWRRANVKRHFVKEEIEGNDWPD